MKIVIVVSLALVLCLAANPGSATLVTSLPGGTVMPMPASNYFGAGPQSFGPGITWSSSADSYFGYSGDSGSYGFGPNGDWDGGLGPMAALTYGYGPMTFTFSSPVEGVGGFLNYANTFPPCTIGVYDSSNNPIESYTLTFTTGGGTNTGFFFGFLEGSSNIKYFTLTNDYIGITNLTVQGNPVPLPAAAWLLGSGLLGLAGWRRLRKA